MGTDNIEQYARKIAPLFERVKELWYYLPDIEEGLADKKRGEAARAECRGYFKTFLVYRSMSLLIFYIDNADKIKDVIEYDSLESVLAEDGDFPSYLDAFEEYVRNFGDAWFDREISRTTYFYLMLAAFLSVVNEFGTLAGVSIQNDEELRDALGVFERTFLYAAACKEHETRQGAVPDLLASFREIRQKIEPVFQTVIKTEGELVKKFPGLKPIDVRGKPLLTEYAKSAKTKKESLCRRIGDERPSCHVDDDRYDRIECLASIWARMPPSVMRFVECCRLLDESAVLACKGTMDCFYSSRMFVASLCALLFDHPKSTAKSVSDLSFAEEEKGQMCVAFQNMSMSLLRLRQKLKAANGMFNPDPDKYDNFISAVHFHLEPKSSDYKALLFEDGNAKTNDGYNSKIFEVLCCTAQTKLRTVSIRSSEKLVKEMKTVEQAINRAYASGSRDVIEETYDALIREYFNPDTQQGGRGDPPDVHTQPPPPSPVAAPKSEKTGMRFEIKENTPEGYTTYHDQILNATYVIPNRTKAKNVIDRLMIADLKAGTRQWHDNWGGVKGAFVRDPGSSFKDVQIVHQSRPSFNGVKTKQFTGKWRIRTDEEMAEWAKTHRPARRRKRLCSRR